MNLKLNKVNNVKMKVDKSNKLHLFTKKNYLLLCTLKQNKYFTLQFDECSLLSMFGCVVVLCLGEAFTDPPLSDEALKKE